MICKIGETKEGKTTVTLERENSVFVTRNVPAEICDNCGEYYLDEETTQKLMRHVNEAVNAGAEFEVRQFAA